MKVTFKDIGRGKISFTADIKSLTYNNLYKAVKGYLMSKDIDFEYNEERKKGVVWAGIMCVGFFEVEN